METIFTLWMYFALFLFDVMLRYLIYGMISLRAEVVYVLSKNKQDVMRAMVTNHGISMW